MSRFADEPGELQIELTEDGSITLRDRATGELFHNPAGAWTEACENYLLPSRALNIVQERGAVKVLDVCFGLGYNSLVLLAEALRLRLSGEISLVALESDRGVLALWRRVLADARFADLEQWLKGRITDEGFVIEGDGLTMELEIRCCDFRQALPQLEGVFDLVFHDPFSPGRLPQLWTIDIFQEYSRLLAGRGGSVLTYSSAVAVRSALQMCGFTVRRTAAVGAKSGGTLASLTPGYYIHDNNSFPLSDEEEARLKTTSAVPYRDPSLTGEALTVRQCRQRELGEVASRRAFPEA